MKLVIVLVLFILFPSFSYATPEYASQTGFQCQTCHTDPTGGVKLTKAGEDFREGLRIKGLYHPLSPIQKAIRLMIGYLHLLTAIAWFGTILYVHILLKPAYAAKGLPKGELLLGWLGIVIIAMTGTLLTLTRIPTLETFYTTRFGILLSIKILLFSIMATTALIVTFVIGPKLKRQKEAARPLPRDRMTPPDLLYFDGREGRPSYFAYKGKIYDVTSSKLWKGGNHMKKHSAGNELTEFLKTAPHGEDRILAMPEAGSLVASETKSDRPLHEKGFYFMAYLNLVFVFLITFVVALMRWG